MSKAIMISDKPKWCALMMNGIKNIEVRKTMPKCDLPIDVYIYCTKEEKLYDDFPNVANRFKHNKVYIGKNNLSGKVVAKFTLNKVEEIKNNGRNMFSIYYTDCINYAKLQLRSCLDLGEIHSYLKGKTGYAWHISNLVIFDKPKELSEFRVYKPNACEKCWCVDNSDCLLNKNCPKYRQLTKAPQSWCYVEVE